MKEGIWCRGWRQVCDKFQLDVEVAVLGEGMEVQQRETANICHPKKVALDWEIEG